MALLVAALSARAVAAQEAAAPLLRVFLTDGTALASFGEWVRMDDRVVFSLPLSADAAPELQLVTLAAGRVDWPRTERYATAARAVHYTATRAEDDYAQFSNQVAAVLTGIAREPDPKRRLAVAESARKAMADWPNDHYGYRAADVQQMLTLIDEVISELRVAAGQDSFELGLVASTPPIPADPLLPPPTTAELAEQLLVASTIAEPADRGTLLQRLVQFIDRAAALLPATWAAKVRTTRTRHPGRGPRHRCRLRQARRQRPWPPAAGTPRPPTCARIERVRATALKNDAALGAQTPGRDGRACSPPSTPTPTRRAGCAWRAISGSCASPSIRSYRRAVLPALRELQRATPPLEDIREQAGPEPETLKQVMARFYKARPAVKGTRPPEALASPHALLQSAWDLADNAMALRLRAVESGDSARAAEASAAAAGALMLMARAREDIDRVLKPPSLP